MSFKRDADSGNPTGASRSRQGNHNFLLILCTTSCLLNTLLLLLLLFRGQPPLSAAQQVSQESQPVHEALTSESSPPERAGETVAEAVIDSVGGIPDSLLADHVDAPNESVALAETPATTVAPPPVIKRSSIRIQVLNATNVSKLAARGGETLSRKGYDVRETGNSQRERGGNTRVYSRIQDTAAALQVASDLGLGSERVSLKPDRELVDVDVTVVIGVDHRTIGALGAGN
ncbi:MAG: LytR C-terminal domain-containing protein [Calditrichaeota bacterium]|nr:LytR C-terminal domain-containing protein [Candidatus Cloacimonadota bacterium]MCB1048557.1 LytR C-terminal domain-containing protein [Calditrichota bacterium]